VRLFNIYIYIHKIFILIIIIFLFKNHSSFFWDAKLVVKFLYSRFSNINFSIDSMVNQLISLVTFLILDKILSILILKNFFLQKQR
jgi:hypothetical protein